MTSTEMTVREFNPNLLSLLVWRLEFGLVKGIVGLTLF
jgi:hypothetical protein